MGWRQVNLLQTSRSGFDASSDKMSRRTFSSWVVYFIAILYIACVLASAGYGYFSLFLKSLKNADGTKVWSVSAINAIPIGGSAIQVVFGKDLHFNSLT